MSADLWQITIAVVGIVVAFFSSVWVNAVSRLSKGRAMRLQDSDPKIGKLLVLIAENPPSFVTGVLLLMLIARVTSTVLVAGLFIRRHAPVPEVLAIATMSFILFQFAEVAPRTWVLERLDQVLAFSARPVYLIGRVLAPVTTLLVSLSRIFLVILPGRGLPRGPLTSEEEIKSIVDVAESEEIIEAEEREMIHSIFEFGDTVVREVMVPRPDMLCIDADATLQEVLDMTLKKGVSRIPVIEGSIDGVVGIIYEKDVIKKLHSTSKAKPKRAGEVAREATFVPESKKVAELLREMQRAKTHMVIVVDEYGGTSGLATLEDLLEEIVGEISDEYDREDPNVVRIEDGRLRVSARLGIDELNEILGCELPHEDWDSVGGLVGGMLGKVPTEGEFVRLNGIHFEVERMKGRRIYKILVSSGAGHDS
ncbi:MAG: hemolysin family protein [Actinomycetota bacterium]|nr:hemolysin family protein [Actinomycetota bacterium]